MKIYEGKRTMDGLIVTVDGQKLPEHDEVKQFTRRGFEWTYEGTARSNWRWPFCSIISATRTAPSRFQGPI